jgi:hypothetical protein
MPIPNPINSKAYLRALEGGRVEYAVAPTTSWRLPIEAADLQSEASTVFVGGTVNSIEDGDFEFTFYDADDNDVARIDVTVGGGTPADEDALAAAIVAAALAEGDLDDYLDAATSDGAEFTITFLPGMGLRLELEPGPAMDNITVAHFAELNLGVLNERNTFPGYVTREADPYVLVTEAWPADAVITVEDSGVANSQVISQAPIDALGVVETASPSTLSASDMVEPAWNPVATFDLGDDPFPATGALEVIVPFSPIFAPVRLPS